MRLWSIHPKYLDPQGLVALWRESLLARAVLRGQTIGYRHHPQLQRFRDHRSPRFAISAYLAAVHAEAESRAYSFDRSKIGAVRSVKNLSVTSGQIAYEWEHLLQKLSIRTPALYRRWKKVITPECHPSFCMRTGPVESWEKKLTRDESPRLSH